MRSQCWHLVLATNQLRASGCLRIFLNFRTVELFDLDRFQFDSFQLRPWDILATLFKKDHKSLGLRFCSEQFDACSELGNQWRPRGAPRKKEENKNGDQWETKRRLREEQSTDWRLTDPTDTKNAFSWQWIAMDSYRISLNSIDFQGFSFIPLHSHGTLASLILK